MNAVYLLPLIIINEDAIATLYHVKSGSCSLLSCLSKYWTRTSIRKKKKMVNYINHYDFNEKKKLSEMTCGCYVFRFHAFSGIWLRLKLEVKGQCVEGLISNQLIIIVVISYNFLIFSKTKSKAEAECYHK